MGISTAARIAAHRSCRGPQRHHTAWRTAVTAALAVVLIAGCGAGAVGDTSPNAAEEAGHSAPGESPSPEASGGATDAPAAFGDYGVEALDPSAVPVCDLVPLEDVNAVGVSMDTQDVMDAKCVLSQRLEPLSSVHVSVDEIEGDNWTAVEHVLTGELQQGTVTGELDEYPFSQTDQQSTCSITVATSDRFYVNIFAMQMDDSCDKAAAVGSVVLDSAPPAKGD